MQFLGMIDQESAELGGARGGFQELLRGETGGAEARSAAHDGADALRGGRRQGQDRADTIVPIDARPDMLYRVSWMFGMTSFALSVQGQMVDSWSEPRLRHGGIGFFTRARARKAACAGFR